ncbi:type III secretion system protein BsaR [Burkholderia pseudomallei]|uniref:type III secretion system protein BsaR n=1 Tax=Burkholderia pseudomallei TaxID=28450 RepID=UPI000537109D|nr:type III secretion system protein BsaR [Burkholderia pseudomallei]KGV01292.1 invasion B family protein [Burkholderia pseudomallei MSHR4372]KGW59456.1 invasion B family protein [Burkholderia pseudomallei MSHR1029]MBD2956101.1 hypothetical protein [Burkholderia pseudomallei]MBD2975029.1 hypothetical protein [Burkholderia pseudomallei]CAJ6374272.1 type III secretion system protein BsaR [Burkholderia pseudomallei]
MNVDVVMLVKESMEKMDCGNAIAGELDAHAPICIAFHSIPEMFVERDGEHVTIWSRLGCAGESQLARCAFDLLAYQLPRGSDAFASRRPLLSFVDDALVLHGRVEPRCLADAEGFTEALETFYADLCAVSEILAR